MIFQGHVVRVQLRSEGIAELCFDTGGALVNKLDVRTIEERQRKTVDPETAQLLASIQSGVPRSFSDQELLERLMLPMIVEAVRCLEEGIAASAAELDMSPFTEVAAGPVIATAGGRTVSDRSVTQASPAVRRQMCKCA